MAECDAVDLNCAVDPVLDKDNPKKRFMSDVGYLDSFSFFLPSLPI